MEEIFCRVRVSLGSPQLEGIQVNARKKEAAMQMLVRIWPLPSRGLAGVSGPRVEHLAKPGSLAGRGCRLWLLRWVLRAFARDSCGAMAFQDATRHAIIVIISDECVAIVFEDRPDLYFGTSSRHHQ